VPPAFGFPVPLVPVPVPLVPLPVPLVPVPVPLVPLPVPLVPLPVPLFPDEPLVPALASPGEPFWFAVFVSFELPQPNDATETTSAKPAKVFFRMKSLRIGK
jgi:hypothetical protein